MGAPGPGNPSGSTPSSDLADSALRDHEPWTRHIADNDCAPQRVTMSALTTVAAYRSKWVITSTDLLGPASDDKTQHCDRMLVERAVRAARHPFQRPSSASEHAVIVPVAL